MTRLIVGICIPRILHTRSFNVQSGNFTEDFQDWDQGQRIIYLNRSLPFEITKSQDESLRLLRQVSNRVIPELHILISDSN